MKTYKLCVTTIVIVHRNICCILNNYSIFMNTAIHALIFYAKLAALETNFVQVFDKIFR